MADAAAALALEHVAAEADATLAHGAWLRYDHRLRLELVLALLLVRRARRHAAVTWAVLLLPHVVDEVGGRGARLHVVRCFLNFISVVFSTSVYFVAFYRFIHE